MAWSDEARAAALAARRAKTKGGTAKRLGLSKQSAGTGKRGSPMLAGRHGRQMARRRAGSQTMATKASNRLGSNPAPKGSLQLGARSSHGVATQTTQKAAAKHKGSTQGNKPLSSAGYRAAGQQRRARFGAKAAATTSRISSIGRKR